MPKITYPNQLANGNTSDADEVMANFNEARAVGNAIDDENIGPLGINEVNSASAKILLMDITAGHTHDGIDGRELAAATSAVRGAFRALQVTHNFAGVAGWSSELNQGALTTIVMARALWSNSVTGTSAGYLDSIPTGSFMTPPEGWSSRFFGGTSNGVYLCLDDTQTPNRVWIYNYGDADDARVFLMGF